MLITFEGIDGCGKSTQIEKICKALIEKGYDVHLFREPGGTALSEQIRDLLLKSKEDIHPLAEALLFSAARAQLVTNRIKPLLKSGAVVVLDRFYDSTTAYQGYGRQSIPVKKLEGLNRFATEDIQPDVTFYLKLDPKEASRRKEALGEEDRMERSGISFFQRVSKGYDEIASKSSYFVTIDGSLPPDEIFCQIMNHLEEKLPS